MTSVAVVAHRYKRLGGGLRSVRNRLGEHGFSDPLWYEIARSRDASAATRQALDDGADLVFVWGGDGTVQRCVEAAAGESVDLAIIPAGTANLLANNLGIPSGIDDAVDVGLFGASRRLDVGTLNGKRFAVMAGVGFDAVMMRNASKRLKELFGRLAYVWTGMRACRMRIRAVRIVVDGNDWFDGEASCVLLGQMGSLPGGLSPFPDAKPDDGLLEVGVTTAKGPLQWARVLVRVALRQTERSPFTKVTRAREVDVHLDEPTAYQLDGGARKPQRLFRAAIDDASINVRVPHLDAP